MPDTRHPPTVAPRVRTLALALACGMALCACAPPDGDAPAREGQAQAPVQATAPPGPSPAPAAAPAQPDAPGASGDTLGGDGSPIRLEGLGEDDLGAAALAGELACSFSGSDAGPLLLARGDVGSTEPAQGVVKVAGYVERVRAPGGFEGITGNPTFTGQGKTIRIEATGPAVGGGESPPRPATLTYLRADGASRSFAGQWQCGP